MGATPMMAQYLDLKAEAGDALLFYRMGDFYELFFDDAEAAAAALDIALTRRGRHDGRDVAMCGVPVHSADGYLRTLIRKGFRVAICEQLETPEEARRRGSKALVRRGIVRLVTPGTLTEETLLEPRAANHLAAWAERGGTGALAWCDVSTGEVGLMACDAARASAELARLWARELLIADGGRRFDAAEAGDPPVTTLPASAFDVALAEARLVDVYEVATLDGFGRFEPAELAALGALVEYLDLTQRGRLPRLRPPRRASGDATMSIDASTRRNLELTRGPEGRRSGSLLEAIDETVTAAGARMLERRMSAPSRDVGEIARRLDGIEWAVGDARSAVELRTTLQCLPDVERAVQRLALDRGGPRDVGSVQVGARAIAEVDAILRRASAPFELPHDAAGRLVDLERALAAALVEKPPANLSDGGAIRDGVSDALDRARHLRDRGRAEVAGLQARYAVEASVGTLKIRHNRVLGYFVEVTPSHGARMQRRADLFSHRQSTAGALRYGTNELATLEAAIETAAADAAAIEAEEFGRLRDLVRRNADVLSEAVELAAEVDIAVSNALRARDQGWCRPIVGTGREFEVVAGRHPVVEKALRKAGRPFVGNDLNLTPSADAAAIRIVTGPNMGGKSTWLRQNALLVILAQCGLYVPAEQARFGCVSQLYSRIGASDDLAQGRSTFMVEVSETAAILNQADSGAFVVLDEIGRGTSTEDGMAIAWSVVEHLRDVTRCRVLFATHFLGIARLAELSGGSVRCATVDVAYDGRSLAFLHRVRDGVAERSYGLEVGRLAGLPLEVVRRAEELVHVLRSEEGMQRDDKRHVPRPSSQTTSLGEATNSHAEIVDLILAADIDAMSPRQAMDLLYDVRDVLVSNRGASPSERFT